MDVFDYLLLQGIEKKHILNYESGETYTGCPALEFDINYNARGLSACCAPAVRMDKEPFVIWQDGYEDTLDLWIKTRDELISSIRNNRSCICTGCPVAIKSWYPDVKKFQHVYYGHYTPCQMRCFYCPNIYDPLPKSESHLAMESLKVRNFSAFIKLLENRDLIARNVKVMLSSGEITISRARKILLTQLRSTR